MPSSFHSRLINGPFDDPGLFVSFPFEKRAILFDIGDIYSISAKNILKTSHIFVTHTHMDHFSGFDWLLRLFLGREKDLFLYGPKGFLNNIEGKLAGYTWNLVDQYKTALVLHVTEVRHDTLITKQYKCTNRFEPEPEIFRQPFNGILLKEPGLTVHSAILDHKIPCLGFSLKEQFHINIIKSRLDELGLETGPWLKAFKLALQSRYDSETKFEVGFGEKGVKKKTFALKKLADKIAIITPGQKIVYIADAAYSLSNIEKIVALAKDTDHMFIEAVFLEKHKEIAEKKYHLTAKQAGKIAGLARARQFSIFHFSPRYRGNEPLLQNEAKGAYNTCIDR